MNTLTRSLIAVATAGAVFAASFAVTSALRPDEFPVDAPIAVPAATTQQATVLTPVGQGEQLASADPLELDLSSTDGSMAVVVPDSPPTGPGAPPAIIAAAAALDAAAGDASLLVGATGEGEAPPAPASATPSEPASDPCAPTEGEPSAACPEGLTATLFSLSPGEDLRVYAAADPVTGPGMGSSIYCDVTAVPDGALRLGALTNDTGTVTVTYWPQDDPATVTSVTLTQVQVFTEGSARHCGETEPLAEGRYEATAFAINDDGVVASPWSFTFDSRGRPTVPPMHVVPLGSNWIWVGVYHAASETADVKGFPLVDGGPTTCEEARPRTVSGLRQELATHTGAVSGAWLDARHYNPAYTRVTSTLLYVPEGTGAGVCGLTFATGEPSWDVDEPERTQFTTIAAPDSWEAVVTLRSVTVYRPGSVQLQALTHLGNYCGDAYADTFDVPASDTPTTVEVGAELCRVGGQNVQIDATTFFTPEAGGSGTGEKRARFALLGASCTGACPEPSPRTYTVFLPGLGQDACPESTSDDCDLRRRTAGARAVIDVTWERGGEGERERWAVAAPADIEGGAQPAPDAARFDTLAVVEPSLGRDGFTASATAALRWDRPVTYSVQPYGSCFGDSPTAAPPSPITGTARPVSTGVYGATISVNGLCPGHGYGLAVTFTDEAGHTQTAAPPGEGWTGADVVWNGGGFVAPRRYLNVTASVEIMRNDRVEASYLVRDSFVDVNGHQLAPSFGPFLNDRCFYSAREASDTDTMRVGQARTYDITPALNVISDWYRYPRSATCEWRSHDWWVPQGNATVTLAQLLAGVEITGDMVPRAFPDAEESVVPFTYRIVLTAEYATED